MMQTKVKRILIVTLGIVFILLGLCGLVLPFLQGILFLIIGLLLVSLCFPRVRLWINKQAEPYPKLLAVILKAEKWILRFIGEVK